MQLAPVGITEQGIPADVSDCSITSGGRGGVSVGGQWEKELEYGSIACVVVMLRGIVEEREACGRRRYISKTSP